MHTILDQPVSALPGIGPAVAKRLGYLDIRTIRDLLWHVPFRYEDFRTVKKVADVRVGEQVTIHATLKLIANRRSPRRGMALTEAMVRDETGSLSVIWFNQPFLAKSLKIGDQLMLAGRVQDKYGTVQLVSPSYEKLGTTTVRTDRLTPVYTTTAGLTQKQLRFFVATALRSVGVLKDPLPEDIRTAEHLLTHTEILHLIHFPKNEIERDTALQRLKFDELLLFQLRRLAEDTKSEKKHAHPVTFQQGVVRDFVAQLPFSLTAGQKKAAWDILQDLQNTNPMHRMLEGDVGSGKTVVAAIAAVNVLHARSPVVLMAPTEILARQHFANFANYFASYDVPVLLWTHGFHEFAERGKRIPLRIQELAKLLQDHPSTMLIGTHALLQERVQFGTVGLVIVDEQQRFGVGQRELLRAKGVQNGIVPHFLSLTATPIPRTLALALAGDLQLSLLNQLPKGRKPITTKFVPPNVRAATYQHVADELARGRQAFIVAPLIEPSDRLGMAAATELWRETQKLLPNFRIGLLHGKLPSKQKDAILTDFAKKKYHALVSTAVIEVGIDMPNASIMIIEGAERFGLSQLHQLRGRIGRGGHTSFCYLIASEVTHLTRKRLEAVANTNDGFALAELDLKLRGPGDLIGTLQSGFLDFRFASLGDHQLIAQTARVAEALRRKDPTLQRFPLLAARIQAKDTGHGE